MRKTILAGMTVLAAAAATLAGAAPAAAYDYPWCIQGTEVGYPGDCAYTSYQQCLASASGRLVYCGINPMVAFQQQHPQPQSTRRARAPRGTSIY